MLRTLLSVFLIGLIVLGANSVPAIASQSNDDANAIEKVRLKVAKMGVGDKAKVTVRMKNGTKIKGFVSQASANEFTVRNNQTGDPTTIAYSDVLKVEANGGHSTARNLALGIGIGVGAFLLVLVAVFASLND
jgi:hypothetical protein